MKRTNQIGALVIAFILLQSTACAQSTDEWMVYKNVEDAGFSSSKLNDVTSAFEQMKSESFMVVHKGNVVLSLGDPSRRFMSHSIRKSFMSAMYGIYIEKDQLDLDKTLGELGIQDNNSLTEKELSATVEHLITARSGIYHPAAYEPRSMSRNRPERGSAGPGEQFFYNNWDFNTLVTIFNQETGKDFFEAFMEDIASPLGMEDLRMEDMNYRNEPDKSIHPAYLFKVSTRDLARFGQLYLNNGRWNNKKIVSKDWIKQSTNLQTQTESFNGRDGYGYLWWIDDQNFEEHTFYASGLGGHRLFVFPESDLVIVHRVNTYLMQGEKEENIFNLVKLVLDAKTEKASKKPPLAPLRIDKKLDQGVDVSESTLRQYVGSYTHPFFRKIEVYLDQGQLKMKGVILGNFRLTPKSSNQFMIQDLPEMPLEMIKGDDENPKGTSKTEVNERRVPVRAVFYY